MSHPPDRDADAMLKLPRASSLCASLRPAGKARNSRRLLARRVQALHRQGKVAAGTRYMRESFRELFSDPKASVDATNAARARAARYLQEQPSHRDTENELQLASEGPLDPPHGPGSRNRRALAFRLPRAAPHRHREHGAHAVQRHAATYCSRPRGVVAPGRRRESKLEKSRALSGSRSGSDAAHPDRSRETAQLDAPRRQATTRRYRAHRRSRRYG